MDIDIEIKRFREFTETPISPEEYAKRYNGCRASLQQVIADYLQSDSGEHFRSNSPAEVFRFIAQVVTLHAVRSEFALNVQAADNMLGPLELRLHLPHSCWEFLEEVCTSP